MAEIKELISFICRLEWDKNVHWGKNQLSMFKEIKGILGNRYGLTIYFDKEAKVWVIHDPDKELVTQGRTEQEAIESWIDGAILLIQTYRDIQEGK